MKNQSGTIKLTTNASALLTLMSLSKKTLKAVTQERLDKYFEFQETCHDYGSGQEQRRMMNKASRLRREWLVANEALELRNA